MKVKTAGWIFFGGTGLSLVLFLILTAHTFSRLPQRTHENQLSPQVSAGKWTWQKHNCNDCHTILGIGGYYAPDVTKVMTSRDAEWLTRFLKNPQAVWPAGRQMPNLGLTDQEIGDLIAFLTWVNGVDTNNWPPRPQSLAAGAGPAVPPGAAVFKAQGCSACHVLDGSGGQVGPDLSHVGSRRPRAWIADQLRNPKAHNPESIMPSFAQLPQKEFDDLTDFLSGRK